MALMSPGDSLDGFIEYWSRAGASERANAQAFLLHLTRELGVPGPLHRHEDGYSFEFPVRIPTGPGTHSDGRIDLYRRASFVLEAKQFTAPVAEPPELALVGETTGTIHAKKKAGPVRGSDAWDDAMLKARVQAERYARALPAEEPPPPFLIVVDVGHSFEIYADFTQAGKSYLPFPDPRSFRVRLADLREDHVRERLRRIWLDPLSLDPARVSAAVTREVADYLARLATSLEKSGHAPRLVAEFLTRCLFCMFAEDVGLLPRDAFKQLLESLRLQPEGFVPKLRTLFSEMQTGTEFSVILNRRLLRFNGGVFEDASVLPLNALQLGILRQAARQQWKDVEPAIFGTLLERALNPAERHRLGAHYTPRAYVERLVLPTVVEPLRAEWDDARAAALIYAQTGRLEKAREEILRFHRRLCEVTVLDPACGSGNFLYVALEHLKRLEGEVIDAATGFGETAFLELETHSVDPHQFLGIEVNPRAATLAELVLWIGYLQWHYRTRGQTAPAEPVLKKFRNIECRDAVLAWDGEPQAVRDAAGEPVTVWDRRSMKVNLVTGRDEPDEAKRVPLLIYPNARPAKWPRADFIVGNPPFLGKLKLRADLGDSYAETLRSAYPQVPESADFVMYWWHKSAALVGAKEVQRFGLITTNSLRQSLGRRVVQPHLRTISLVSAFPDHPWVDTADGAAVRVAMTVGAHGFLPGKLHLIQQEEPQADGSSVVSFVSKRGMIAADLSVGVDVGAIPALRANYLLASTGLILGGRGFVLRETEAQHFIAKNPKSKALLFALRNGDDFTGRSRNVWVIDTHGWSEQELRSQVPELYQHLYDTVYKERQSNRDARLRKNWWLFRRSNDQVRSSIRGLSRFIVTVETTKHRLFAFFSADIKPEHAFVVFGLCDAFFLGVLSSRIHTTFALAAGGTLEDRPRYNKTRCFDPYPFPDCQDAAKARIRALGEELDAHRKRIQTQHPRLSLTAMYNVLEAIRAERELTTKEQAIYEDGLIAILRQLHDELDAAVAAAYGWPADLTAAEILSRLVALNAQRAAEETAGHVRWLRPEYQNPTGAAVSQVRLGLTDIPTSKVPRTKTPWPKSLAERVRAVETALGAASKPMTAADIAKSFARADSAVVGEILETLATLGRAHRAGDRFAL